MINRVEFIAFHQAQQVGKLECQDAIWLQQDFQAFDKIVQVGNLREYVISKDQVSGASLRCELARHLRAKKTRERRHSLLDRNLGYIGCGFDSEHRYISLDEILKQVAVVAGHLNHKTLRPQPKPSHHFFTIVFRVLEP